MSYLSLNFAVFVAILAFLYYVLPVKLRSGVLLIASLFFYALFDFRYLIFLVFTAFTTFLGARVVNKVKAKKWLVGIIITLNVAVWFAIKELPWVLTTSSRALNLFGIDWAAPTLSFIVPVGLSYFTLQAIAYLVDVTKQKYPCERNFFKYLLFLSWFPAIVQGPISRYNELMPQLLNTNKFSYENTRRSLVLLLFGLIKKMVIADRLGILVNYCFGNFKDLSGIVLYVGAIAYSIQLYADFSGCVDFCRGISGLFGVNLVHNFNRPYLSLSINEFWSRWHISLSSWLKDYIYIPLGGNRKGKFRKYINIIITFFVSGIWHGAGLNFLVWGFMHAIYQVIGDITASFRRNVKRFIGVQKGSASEKIYQMFITFHLVLLAWIFFRANGMLNGIEYIKNMLCSFNPWVLFDGTLFTFGLSQNFIIFLIAHIVILFFIEHRFAKQENVIEGILNSHLILRWIIYLILIFDVLLFGVYGSGYSLSSFMYGGF